MGIFNLQTFIFMKAINNLAAIAITLMSVFFISCGDDDNNPGPTPTPQKKTEVFNKSKVLRGFADSHVSTEAFTIYLSDIIGEDAAHNFVSGERQLAECYIEVNGLRDKEPETILKDFSLKLNDNAPVVFGDCRANANNVNEFESDTKQSTQKVADFIQSVFESYTGSTKKAIIEVSFTPTQDITTEDVSLKLVIKGDYIYNTYLD